MELLGFVAALLTVVAFVPQTVKVVCTRKTRDVSLLTYSMLILTASLWTIYDVSLVKPSIYITNAVIAILSIVIVITKIRVKE